MSNFILFSGQSLLEGSLYRGTDCQGTTYIISCQANTIIAVKSVEYGTKLTTTCSMSNTSAACCSYDSIDCFLPYTGRTLLQDACSGRVLCTPDLVASADSSSCGSDYPITNHYWTVEYYCLPGKHCLQFLQHLLL